MQLDVVNAQNEKVGSLDLRDEVFGGRPKLDVVWEAVVHQNASERRGTHATKNRALVSGSGRKPWRQKGTGRARVGEIRNPLWRKGGTVFGPQPRDYGYALPRKVARGALRQALVQKMSEGAVVAVDRLELAERKTKAAAELYARLGAAPGTGRMLVIDVTPDEALVLATRNLAGVRLVSTRDVTARDVMDTTRVVATTAALERLQEVLGS
jgi:large subunit ribosomal protein L4